MSFSFSEHEGYTLNCMKSLLNKKSTFENAVGLIVPIETKKQESILGTQI